jgi:hypothetical protein
MGLGGGGEGIFDLVLQDSIFSSSLFLWETIFLVEGYLLFVILFFWFFLVDCCMVHCPSFASFA